MARRSSNNNVLQQGASQGQDAAKRVMEANDKFITDTSFDVYKFVENCNDITLRKEPLGQTVSGYIEKNNNKFCIVINSQQNELRQRFTLAHELGHYFIHKDSLNGKHTDVTLFRDANEDKLGIEYAANDFAAELLMPEAKFKSAIEDGTNTPKQLSKLFEVTEKAVMYRAYKLGIIKSFPF